MSIRLYLCVCVCVHASIHVQESMLNRVVQFTTLHVETCICVEIQATIPDIPGHCHIKINSYDKSLPRKISSGTFSLDNSTLQIYPMKN